MKFGQLFEFHKIPEWYNEYVHYIELRELIDQFKSFKKLGFVEPLNGYYTINNQGQIYSIDFIVNYKDDIQKNLKEGEATSSPVGRRRAMSGDYHELAADQPAESRLSTANNLRRMRSNSLSLNSDHNNKESGKVAEAETEDLDLHKAVKVEISQVNPAEDDRNNLHAKFASSAILPDPDGQNAEVFRVMQLTKESNLKLVQDS